MSQPAVNLRDFHRAAVQVEVYRMSDDSEVAVYVTNLANDKQRRVFAEQMTNTYVGGQYSLVSPVEVTAK